MKKLLFLFLFSTLHSIATEVNIPYFAYGSNLSYEFLKERLKDGPWIGDWERSGMLVGEAPIDLGAYVLEDYEFAYSLDVSPFGEVGTAANIIPKKGAKVYGVLYLLSEKQLAELDSTEDIPEAYERVAVKINQLALNTIPYKANTDKVWAYVGNPKYIISTNNPDPEYVRIIIKGATEHHLPEDYIENQLKTRLAPKSCTSFVSNR